MPEYNKAALIIAVGGFATKVRVTLTCPTLRQYEGMIYKV